MRVNRAAVVRPGIGSRANLSRSVGPASGLDYSSDGRRKWLPRFRILFQEGVTPKRKHLGVQNRTHQTKTDRILALLTTGKEGANLQRDLMHQAMCIVVSAVYTAKRNIIARTEDHFWLLRPDAAVR